MVYIVYKVYRTSYRYHISAPVKIKLINSDERKRLLTYLHPPIYTLNKFANVVDYKHLYLPSHKRWTSVHKTQTLRGKPPTAFSATSKILLSLATNNMYMSSSVFLFRGMLMRDQRWRSCCTLSDGKRNRNDFCSFKTSFNRFARYPLRMS